MEDQIKWNAKLAWLMKVLVLKAGGYVKKED
jgi:hypothetical protein